MSKRSTQTAKIIKRVKETKDTVTLRLTLPDLFTWKPGQFIMVRAIIDGEAVRRAYSISSSPTRDQYLEITIRQTEDPTMSKYLNEIQEGETLEVRGPYGKFIWEEGVSDKVVLLSAGSGITPSKAIMEYIMDKNLENPVKLLYSCGHGDNVIFKDLLEDYCSSIENCSYQLSLTREKKEDYPDARMGRIDKEYLKKEIENFQNANFYICGAPGFVKAMRSALFDLGMEREQVHREQWG